MRIARWVGSRVALANKRPSNGGETHSLTRLRARFHVPVSVFFPINGWVGEKKVVPCAHPYHPRNDTPHGWVFYILCYAKTGANGRAFLTDTIQTYAG